MTETSLDELGPVDYLVVEFPAGHSNFTGEGATELARLVGSDTIRVLDLLILTKNADGSYRLYRCNATTFVFSPSGQLTSITDRNANATTLQYTAGRLSTVTEVVSPQDVR